MGSGEQENSFRLIRSNFITPVNIYFIENVGQYNLSFGAKVKFCSQSGGMIIYFTDNGFIIEKRDFGSPEEQHERRKKIERGEDVLPYIPKYISVDFVHSNSSVVCEGMEQESYYYTYDIKDDRLKSNKANCFKKILYKNIYPFIDIEFVIHDNGLKYNIILHPNADPSQIKLKYDGVETIKRMESGGLKIISSFINLEDRAPESKDLVTDEQIKSEFNVSGNEVSFSLNSYNKEHAVVIDPWITDLNPPMGIVFAEDIEYDNLGNVYTLTSNSTIIEVRKYDANGNYQWAFVTGSTSFGDIAVNRLSNEIYVVNPFTSSTFYSAIYRLDVSGNVLGSYNVSSNDPMEFWRTKYDHCNDRLIIGAGGETPTVQSAYADPLLTNLISVNSLGTPEEYQDVSNLAIDPDGVHCYMQIAKSVYGAPLFNNTLIKLPLATLAPTLWQVSNTASFLEQGIPYNNFSTGFNGMACSWNYLYTYDGDTLKQWDKNNGNLMNSTITGGQVFQTAGIDVSSCGKIYIGAGSTMKIYDENLILLNTIQLPGACYDIIIGKDKVYACGAAFIGEFQFTNPALVLAQTPDSCGQCDGTASVNVCGEDGTVNFLWSPGGQTTSMATSLCEGWYNVIVSGGCGNLISVIDSIYVTAITDCSLSVSVNHDTICIGSCAVLQAEAVNNIGTVTYQWDNGIADLTSGPLIVCPDTTTIYTIFAADSAGFMDTTYATVTVLPIPVVDLGNDTSFCGTSQLLEVQDSDLSCLWQDGSVNQSFTATESGLYWVNVYNGACMNSDSIAISIDPPVTVNFADDTLLCEGQTLVLNAQNPGSNYLWSDNSTSPTLSINQSGFYWVNVSSGQCQFSDSIDVLFYFPIAAFTVDDTSGCVPMTASFTDHSLGVQGEIVNWLWDFGDGNVSNLQNPVHQYTQAGGYSVSLTVSTILGCSSDTLENDLIEVYQNPTATFVMDPENPDLSNPTVTFYCESAGAVEWRWDFGDGSTSNEENPVHTYSAAGSYTVNLTVTNANGCIGESSYHFIVLSGFSFYCPNSFTPDESGGNEFFGGEGEGIEVYGMQIFNRWGELIYESHDLETKWNGTYKGGIVQQGTYLWKAFIKSDEGNYYEFIGHVNLLR